MKKQKKTNVMRILDAEKIDYTSYFHEGEDFDKSRLIKQGNVFKTLVTETSKKAIYIYVIPYDASLDLKKAAKAAGVKNVQMIHQKDLLKLTGYVHGGCSPIGMKKFYPTFVDEHALTHETIAISGGKVKTQVSLSSEDLKSVIDFEYADLTKA